MSCFIDRVVPVPQSDKYPTFCQDAKLLSVPLWDFWLWKRVSQAQEIKLQVQVVAVVVAY